MRQAMQGSSRQCSDGSIHTHTCAHTRARAARHSLQGKARQDGCDEPAMDAHPAGRRRGTAERVPTDRDTQAVAASGTRHATNNTQQTTCTRQQATDNGQQTHMQQTTYNRQRTTCEARPHSGPGSSRYAGRGSERALPLRGEYSRATDPGLRPCHVSCNAPKIG
jgi:hypothetical protein